MDEIGTSLMDQNLIGASNSMMGASLGLGMPNPYYNTSFLGGVTMAPRLTNDVYMSVNRERYRNHKGLKNTLIGIGSVLVGTFVLGKFHKLGKSISKLFKK